MKKILIYVFIFTFSVTLGILCHKKLYKKVEVERININQDFFILDNSKLWKGKQLNLDHNKSIDIVGKDDGEIKDIFGGAQYEIGYELENEICKKRIYIYLISDLINNNKKNALYILCKDNKVLNYQYGDLIENVSIEATKEIIKKLDVNKKLK